jgi:tetratricopeptide (TPR) repeat protein
MSKKLLLIGGATVSILVAFGAIFAHIASGDFDPEQKLKLACDWLDKGRWDLASKMAEDLGTQIDVAENSRWHYVTAVSTIIKIKDDLDSVANRRKLLEAIDHLETSRELEFPVGLTAKAKFYLGFCQFHVYRWDEAIESLRGCYQDFPECRSQALQLIFTAQLRKAEPDLQAADATLTSWEAIPGKSMSEINNTFLGRAQLNFFSGKHDQCFPWLDKIVDKSVEKAQAEFWRLRCQLKLTGAEADSSKKASGLAALVSQLKKHIYAPDTPPQIRLQSRYLYAQALRMQNELDAATVAMSVIRQQAPNTAEAVAAQLEEAEILLQLGRVQQILLATKQLLTSIEDQELYNDYWMTRDEIRRRIVAIGEQLRNQAFFEAALELSKQLELAFEPAYALRLQAFTYVDWAGKQQKTLQDPEALTIPVRELYAQAARTFEKLAQVELRSSNYPNLIWHAAEAFQKANQIESANRLLYEYLNNESRPRQPRGYVALGRNLITSGSWQESLIPLEKCLDYFPNSPSCYEVRLLLSKSYAELHNLDKAIELLSSNLWDFDLKPESPIWRDCAVELGHLMYLRGDRLLAEVQRDPPKTWTSHFQQLQHCQTEIQRGIEQLTEVVNRFPQDPRYYHSRYLLAHSYRQASEIPKTIMATDTNILEVAKKQYNQQWRNYLEESAGHFHGLLEALQSASETDRLAPAILRNCYFGKADVLSALGRYEDAISAYRNAASYYVNQPEALEAIVQVAQCQRKLGRDRDARVALRQAEQLLNRIPADQDARFVSTRGDRRHWQELLGWMNKEYN